MIIVYCEKEISVVTQFVSLIKSRKGQVASSYSSINTIIKKIILYLLVKYNQNKRDISEIIVF